MKEKSFRVLIIKIGAIGDVVMAMPLLTALRKKYSSLHVTWICGKQVEPLLARTMLVDQIIAIDENRLFRGSVWRKLSSIWAVWRRLWARRFNLILTLNPDPRYQILSWPLFAKARRSWGKNQGRFRPIPGRAHSQEYLSLLDEEEQGPVERECIFPSLSLDPFIPPSGLDLNREDPLIIIAPGGAKNILAEDQLRRWPIEHYAELIKRLQGLPFRLVVIGGNGDQWVLPYFQNLSFMNCIGTFNLLDLLSLLKSSRLLITHDSGPLHLAKLAQCPVLALFGPTNPAEKVQKGEGIRVLWGGEHLACRPCYNGKTYSACKQNLCLKSLTPDRVHQEILSLIQTSPPKPREIYEVCSL